MNFAVALVALSRNVQHSDRGTVAATASHCIFEWMEQRVELEGNRACCCRGLEESGEPIFTITIVAGAGLEVDVVPLSTRPSTSARFASAPSRRVIIRCARRQTKREEEERRNK